MIWALFIVAVLLAVYFDDSETRRAEAIVALTILGAVLAYKEVAGGLY